MTSSYAVLNFAWVYRLRTRKTFGNWMRNAITEAALPVDCEPHGLRKAAGRRPADLGCSTHEMMAILGHQSLAEAERYTERRQSKPAIKLRHRAAAETDREQAYPDRCVSVWGNREKGRLCKMMRARWRSQGDEPPDRPKPFNSKGCDRS